jgi:rhodanese-related sulfurtransferase
MDFFKQLLGGGGNGVSAQEAQARLSGQDAPLLIDVRQPDEYRAGHIRGAKLIPLDQLDKRMKELPHDREILCVCRSGARSGAATRQLKAAGFNTLNLSGGMMAWQRAGLPVENGKAR